MGKENSGRGIHPSDLSVLAVAVGIKKIENKNGSFLLSHLKWRETLKM
jgi:hypothetical protein